LLQHFEQNFHVHAFVLVDDAAEHVSTDDLAAPGHRARRAGDRLVEIESSVRPGFIVVADGLGKQDLEISL
jgi:hypothetical protein